MRSFVVDPLLCTTPVTDTARPELVDWVQGLESWLLVMEQWPFEWRHFFRCTEKLQELGRFPTFDALRHIQKVSGEDINIGDLLRKLAKFFQDRERDLLHDAVTKDVLLEPSRVAPPQILDRNLPEVRPPLETGLFCLACDKATGEERARGASLVTSPFGLNDKEVIITGTATVTDPEDVAERVGADAIQQRFPITLCPEDLLDYRYDALIAAGEDTFASLIEGVAKMEHPDLPPVPVAVGRRFWPSVVDKAILEDSSISKKLLRICTDLAAGLDMSRYDRRPVRINQAADAPQRVREIDGAKAFRLTVSTHGAGYRLHYWYVSTAGAERVELAIVLHEQAPVIMPE